MSDTGPMVLWSLMPKNKKIIIIYFQHSVECGAGCGIVLLVNSSTIVVIRGPRATLWGSVYLDEHGEEDRDLKYVF